MRTQTIQLGPLTIGVETDGEQLLDEIRIAYRSFLSQEEATATVRVHYEPFTGPFSPPQVEPRDKRIWIWDPYYIGTVDLDSMRTDVRMAAPDEYLLTSFGWLLKACFAAFGLKAQTFMLHAGAVAWEDNGYVFIGGGGAGKSTAVSLCPAGRVIGSDMVIIGRKGGRYRVWGTHFRDPTTDNAEIAGLLLLRKSTEICLTRILPQEMYVPVMSEIHFPFGADNQVRRLALMAFDMARDVLQDAPSYILDFRRDESFWSKLLELPSRGGF